MANLNNISEQLEAINSRKLSDEDKFDIEMWQKGRALAHVINSPGWEVVLELLGSYAERESTRCMNTDPANKDAVLAAHSVAFAASRIHSLFVEDAQNLVNASQRVPEVVQQGLKHASPIPPESL